MRPVLKLSLGQSHAARGCGSGHAQVSLCMACQHSQAAALQGPTVSSNMGVPAAAGPEALLCVWVTGLVMT